MIKNKTNNANNKAKHNNDKAGTKHYVLVSELIDPLLNGEFHLFDKPQLVKVGVQQIDKNRVKIGGKILFKDDCVVINDKTGEIYSIAGPSIYKSSTGSEAAKRQNAFRAVIAESNLSQKILTFNDEEVRLDRHDTALAFDKSHGTFKDGAEQSLVKGYEMILVFNSRDKVTEIIIRSNAAHSNTKWLKDFLSSRNLMRQPSGAFDAVKERLQAEEDRRNEEFLLDAAAEFYANQFDQLCKKISTVSGPKTVEAGGKFFTVAGGKVHRGKTTTGGKPDYIHLYETGKLSEIVAQLTN